jgi:hypothetical protein
MLIDACMENAWILLMYEYAWNFDDSLANCSYKKNNIHTEMHG